MAQDMTPEVAPGGSRSVLLVILDGWGLRAEREANAVALARTPVFDRLWRTCPHAQLGASGRDVGLPEGQMGNSEVGHLTIGAGRVLLQDMTRIDEAIANGEFFGNRVLVGVFDRVRGERLADGGRPPAVHVVGLLSDGGVHSHIRHCFALLELARRQDFSPVFLHAFTDGRDTSPTGGVGYVGALLEAIGATGVGRLATLVGRYYAMDRDRRWERTRIAYDALARGAGEPASDPIGALQAGYDRGVTDEFVKPLIFDAEGRIRSGDGVIFFNFRADRARQLLRAFVDAAFTHFPRAPSTRPRVDGPDMVVRNIATMSRFGDDLQAQVAFPRDEVADGFGETVARAGLRQLRSAETEKYAHVTYFFNGGLEEPWDGEERLLVPSPRVPTYDLQPEMSAPEVTERLIERIRDERPDVVVLNYANPDMVGHTGDLHAAIAAVEAVDCELGRLLEAFPGAALVIADHGNAETMREPDGSPHTAHTTNPVPCILVGAEPGVELRQDGALQDVAPTLLGLLGVEPPAAMRGRDLRIAVRERTAGSTASRAETAPVGASIDPERAARPRGEQ
jgi:2,3-bisphosphoglycerate-independent phosphoglycerate mutase